jgi:hypothetical protein
MNTQVNSEASSSAAPMSVAETVPVPLTPVAAAAGVASTAAVAATLAPRKVIDDFLDEDETPQAPAAAGTAAEVADTDDAESDDNEIIPGLEDTDAADGEEGSDLVRLTDLEDAAEDEQSMVVIDVYKKKCTDCTHLVPWGEKTHKRCHFSNGNELCPAQSVRIRRYIPVDQIVTRFMAAETQGDTDRLVALYEMLQEKAPDVQEEIHAALKAARERKR